MKHFFLKVVKDLSTKENILTRSVIQDKVSSMSFDSLFIALWLDHRSIPLHPSLPPMAQFYSCLSWLVVMVLHENTVCKNEKLLSWKKIHAN